MGAMVTILENFFCNDFDSENGVVSVDHSKLGISRGYIWEKLAMVEEPKTTSLLIQVNLLLVLSQLVDQLWCRNSVLAKDLSMDFINYKLIQVLKKL